MIELKQPGAAGQLAEAGPRSWIRFTLGSPRTRGTAIFILSGPWANATASGKRTRNGWDLVWVTFDPWRSWTVTVETFADVEHLVEIGPTAAAAIAEGALGAVRASSGIKLLSLGVG